ncbi:MAG: long-chain fatty acid--CoA ligase [Bacteroidetes bacterium]|nr:long-chain fatty acid--CoA ligase [Bacteroidota bacterium]
MPEQIHTAPADSGTPVMGRTLTSVFYRACETYGNDVALYQPADDGGWTRYGLLDLKAIAEELAVGMAAIGIRRGDRVGFLLESDVYFCLFDLACQICGAVSVPIYLTHSDDAVTFVLRHSGAVAVVVSVDEQLHRLAGIIDEASEVRNVVVANGSTRTAEEPKVLNLESLREAGRSAVGDQIDDHVQKLLGELTPDTLATIIYTSGTTGVPKGVALSHENISFDGLTSFSGMKGYRKGPEGEIAISFLPLTHVFARSLHYGYIEYGTSIYFTDPDSLSEVLKSVRPTVFLTVPRVIEKVYARIRERAALLSKVQRRIFDWALDLARTAQPGRRGGLRLRIADRLVYSKWREALGGRPHFVISGGAALSEELARIFDAAGIQILQGYGLTETSPVISYNRPDMNKAGTVGVPIPGVEVKIAEDGEILTRGPHVMLGYYNNDEKTREVIDSDGWFHTGDIGEFGDDGFLKITDRKKDLFKLSTGKYVMPQPLEQRLAAEPLVDQAIVTGAGRKFCTALIFPSESALRTLVKVRGLPPDRPLASYLSEPVILKRFDQMIEKANQGIDHWSTIKRYRLLADEVSVENGLLTPTLKIRRAKVNEKFADEIDKMYEEDA